uniref:RidA family protein n=1 Tax=Schlesneria paludicola TaxID=360056 RepID=A0A7C2K1N2_9PLAN
MTHLAVMLSVAIVAAPPRCLEPSPARGQSAAVLVDRGPLVHTGQVFPAGPAFAPTPPAEQVTQAFSRLGDVLLDADARLSEAVKINVYVRHPSVMPLVEKELSRRFPGDHRPAVSYVQTALPDEAVVVAVDAVAPAAASDQATVKRARLPASDRPAPAAVLPSGSVSYISGQAEKGDGTLADATKQTMASLFRTLEFLGSAPADVVHMKAFLTPMSDSATAVKEMAAAFGEAVCPPVSLVEWVSSTPIEIELVVAARRPEGDVPPLEYLTPPGMTASPVYARVVRIHASRSLYVSGLYGATDAPHSAAEVRDLFATLTRVLQQGGSDLKHLAKATYYVSDPEPSRLLNTLRPEYYDPLRPPAASKAQVIGTGQPSRSITLDMIAVPREE